MEKNYVMFNENDSRDFSLVEEVPLPNKAEPKINFIEIEGRHGYLTFDTGKYAPIDYSLEFIVNGRDKVQHLRSVFRGSGKLHLSCLPQKYYKAYVCNVTTFERQVRNVYKCIVEFKLQPFIYELQNNIVTFNGAGTIYNPTNVTAQPIIKVNGSGTGILSINNKDFRIESINGTVILDYELKEAYGTDGSNRNNTVLGEYDELLVGQNTISWNGGITSIQITPNFRWV